MHRQRILVVDDEPQMHRFLGPALTAAGYEPIRVETGRQALAEIARRPPDAVVLDLGLPDIDGLDVIAEIRSWSDVPVLVLSARTAEPQKVAALDAGANDYIDKPFGMDELLARVRVALRAPIVSTEAVVVTPDFTVDLGAKRVRRDGQDVRLTATEWQVVELLARNPGRLVTKSELLEKVWGLREAKNNYVSVFLVAIRRKLEPDPSHPRYLITEPGSGVRFVPEGADADPGHQEEL